MECEKNAGENSKGFYEIRLESIGGLGANVCTKMLGELGCRYLGLNSMSFSSYGSEKTGTPVKGYIRYSDRDEEILINTPVRYPRLLAVFHSALLSVPDILEGCNEKTIVLVNYNEKEDADISEYADVLDGRKVYFINARQIANESHSRINVIMLGAIARLLGNVSLEQVENICSETLGKKYPATLKSNLMGVNRGYNEVKEIITGKKENANLSKNGQTMHNTMLQGGVIPYFGNIIVNDLSASRQGFIPVFIQEKCINCGLCDTTCPDMVFFFEKGEYRGREMMLNKGIDYYHCKGCLRCVDVCPVNALVKERDDKSFTLQRSIADKALVKLPVYYEKSGADGYITSEAYLTEKRIDGGEI